MNHKKIYIIAGEPSGDLHGSRLMKSLKKIKPNISFRFFGGDLMQNVGGTLVKHYKELAFMGLWEVIKNLKTINQNLKFCKKDILDWKPDIIILVDYPGFNLKIAEFAHKEGIKVHYYISPKIWVWKQSRIKKIKKYIDKMFIIFPFEVDFYKKFDYKVEYLGNPTVDIVQEELKKPFNIDTFIKENNLSEKPIIALLPGSREQEILKILPIMIEVSKQFTDYQFIIAGVSALPESLYKSILQNTEIKFIVDKTYELLKISVAAVVTSGTATLETALFKVPQVVCYKTSKLTYAIGRTFVKIDYFSLVNILMEEQVVKELLQKNLKKDIVEELQKILTNTEYKNKMIENYEELADLLGESGSPNRTAKIILNIKQKRYYYRKKDSTN